MIDCCAWCWQLVKISEPLEEGEMAFCTRGCFDAENLFRLHFSDENIERRNADERGE